MYDFKAFMIRDCIVFEPVDALAKAQEKTFNTFIFPQLKPGLPFLLCYTKNEVHTAV